MRGHVLQHPREIARIVGGEAQFGAIGHDAGERVERRSRDDAALVMAELRPGVGKENEDARERGVAQRGEQEARVVEKEADVGKVMLLDLGQELGDAVFEHLAADEAHRRMRCRLRRQMLAGAEADLEPDRFDWAIEEGGGR